MLARYADTLRMPLLRRLLPVAAAVALGSATPIPPPGPERQQWINGSMFPGGPPVVHNNSCFAAGALHVPFQDPFPPRYPQVAPRYHICNSCHGENDPCASFYHKGWYHYFYRKLAAAPPLALPC